MTNKSVRKSVSITEKQDKYIREHNVSLSALVQGEIDKLRDSKNPYIYTTTKALVESRKMSIVMMLVGALWIVVTMGVFFFLWRTELTAFFFLWIVGAVLVFYGGSKYSRWDDLIYARSSATHEAETE